MSEQLGVAGPGVADLGVARGLTGKVALITGATRGIGAAVARRFAADGAHVVLLGRSVGALEELDDAIRLAGGVATLVPIDLTEFCKIDELAGAIDARFGRLDIMVGNAATLGTIGPMGHMSPDIFQKVMDLNLTANWRLGRAFEPLMRKAPKAWAIFTTCAMGHDPTAFWSAYATSKAALEMMVKTWAAETTAANLTISLLDPGPTRTALRRAAFPAEDPQTLPEPDRVAEMFREAISL